MSDRVNKIVKRSYYAVEISLRSPLALPGGENEVTDMDVLRNGKDEVFIPGTSIAGAFRGYLQKSKQEECSFGFSRGEDGRMSSVYISDIYFDKEPVISVRDGVQLSGDKQVENKFDMEVIETGAAGILYLNYVTRENDKTDDTDREVAQLIRGMESGEIRFGSNKNRGFGRFAVKKVYQESFTPDQVTEWISFSQKIQDLSAYSVNKEYKEWIRDFQSAEQKYYVIRVPLQLTGGISIRKYSTQPMKADFEHVTCNGEAVIPGTSWNGAIRADVKNILKQLGCSAEKSKDMIDKWFGYVNVKKGKKTETRDRKRTDARQSMVVIGESIIRNTVPVPMTRNKISRFDASTIESALYSEITRCGGETELEIMVKKDEDCWYYALLAILELVIQDICKGYVSVGGQAAVGRGIFSGSSDGILDKDTRKCGQQELLWLIEGRE